MGHHPAQILGTEQLQNVTSAGGLSLSSWLWIVIGAVTLGIVIYHLFLKKEVKIT